VEALEDRNLPSGGFVFTTLDVPNAGTGRVQGTTPFGLNDLGQIVGSYVDANSIRHGFLFSGGTYTTYDYPGSSYTDLNGVNDLGVAVGHAFVSASNSPTFQLQNGVFTALPLIKGAQSYPLGINASGEIVGQYHYLTSPTHAHGFLLTNGEYDTINAPNGGGTSLVGVNDYGQIVGSYDDVYHEVFHSFLLQSGQFTPVAGPPGGHEVMASGINDRGTIVGTFWTGVDTQTHGFLEKDGQYVTFDEPNAADYTYALGINALGQVVGYYLDANTVFHGFLATPTGRAEPHRVVSDQGLINALGNPGTVPQPTAMAADMISQATGRPAGDQRNPAELLNLLFGIF
jgi:probable HAF family extracellular repeat protein